MLTLLLLYPLAGTALGAEPPPEVAGDEAPETGTEPPPTPPSPDSEGSEADLEAIEAALAADLPPAPVPAPAPTGSPSLQSLNPDLSLIVDVAAAAFGSDPTPLSLQSGGHDPTRNGFNLQQVELSANKAVDPYFRFDGNIVFSLFGVEVEEAYATTLALPGRAQIRAGQFLHRFGRINATHPHTWDFVDQAFPIGRLFGGEGNRGLGVEGSILLPLPWSVELVAATTHVEGEAVARTWAGAVPLGVASPLDLETVGAIKQFFPLGPDLSLAWGLSWAGGPNGTGRSNRSEIFGTDLYLKFRPITVQSNATIALQSEWFYRRRQIPGDVLSDLNGYTQLSWRFAQRWGTALRHELGGPALGLDLEPTDDPQDPDWTTTRQRFAADLTYWPTEFSRLRLQAATDRAAWIPQPAWSAFLAFEFNVGAHGAHAF